MAREQRIGAHGNQYSVRWTKYSVPGTQYLARLIALALVFVLVSPASAERIVYVASGLTDEQLIVCTASVAASSRTGPVLIDVPAAAKANAAFLAAYKPERIVPIGHFPDGTAELEQRLDSKLAPALEWGDGPTDGYWKELYPTVERVVVSPAEPSRLLLQSATLAGALGAPLLIRQGGEAEEKRLMDRLAEWKPREVFAVAGAAAQARELPGGRIEALANEEAVARLTARELARKNPVRTLVVANPEDVTRKTGRMSLLAPAIAIRHRAPLLLTNEAGENVEAVVEAATKREELRHADVVILVADLRAIPTHRRPNPAAGKDETIEMEPLTPEGESAYTFAVGRLFHEEPAITAVVLARQLLLAGVSGPRRALVVSNPGGGLPLLETFSRNTTREIRNAGYQTTSLFGDDVTPQKVRQLVPEQDIFLWEGHYRTLIDDFGFLTWTERLPPSLIMLQSCLALNEKEAQPLLERGAVALVGTATRTYSGTGGAFTLAFFDGMLYNDQSLGGALRQSKNFLVTYTILKKKRLGDAAKLTGANIRSAWAFTLWGDPTLTLPKPEAAQNALPAVTTEVHGNTILLKLPDRHYDPVKVGKYEARLLPNSRLAGLITSSKEEEDMRMLVPFLFTEVRLPNAPEGKTPHLHGRLPERNWVFLWDARRKAGYLLVTPRGRDTEEVRFRVEWEDQ